jgi:hypothetical protein
LHTALLTVVLLATMVSLRETSASDTLPAVVFVARAHLATRDYVFPQDDGPAGQLTAGLAKFAPGSKLIIRQPDGSLHTLVDTSRPSGDTLNPLGLADLQSPDVAFDATRIVFAGTTGPSMPPGGSRPQFSWRLYEINVDGTGLHQLTHSDRTITIPDVDSADTSGNATTYGYYDDMFPAYLVDGRIVFSSSRYPSRSHYDNRTTFNLYVINGDGSGLHRITSERGGALHPTPLPDGRILFSRWWINFNQPSETGIYQMIDNLPGSEPVYDSSGNPVLDRNNHPITGHRLPDGTLVYSLTTKIEPAQAQLADKATVRRAPDTWHLMTVDSDGTNLQRYAWTPRYPWQLTVDSGHDSFAAAQPSLVISGTQTVVAYTTQYEGTMSHTTHETGIRIAWPGIENMYRNTTDSIAGYRAGPNNAQPIPPFALHPAGLPDGRILFSQTFTDTSSLASGNYNFTQDGKTITLPLQGSWKWRYQLRTIRADGTQSAPLALNGGIGSDDAMDAKPIVARPIGNAPNQWRAQADTFTTPLSDDPTLGNVPTGLQGSDGQPVYTWSKRSKDQIALTTLYNPNVYANPPLSLPYVNNSPPIGRVAYADIYIDANQFSGVRVGPPDSTVRAVKWTTVPVDEHGSFTAQVPADTPAFVVLRDKQGHLVRGGNRSSLAIAQGNAWGRPGQTVTCVGCHMGHVSGSQAPLASLGWSNIAPSAVVTATSEWRGTVDYNGSATHLVDRRNYVPGAGATSGAYQDRTPPWIAADHQGVGQVVRLDWSLPVAVMDVHFVGAEPGQDGFSADYQVSGELRFYLAGQEIVASRRSVGPVAPFGQDGTTIQLPNPIAVDRITFTITAVAGTRNGEPPAAALSEIEVIGQGAAAAGSGARPAQVQLPLIR